MGMVNQGASEHVGFYDIYDPFFEPFWRTPLFYYSVVAMLALVIIGIIFFMIRSKRSTTKTAWQKAYEQCQALQPFIAACDARPFYQKLTSITKQYVSERYGDHVMNKTDQEFVAWLSADITFSDETKRSVKDMFVRAGEIKFAPEQAGVQAMEKDRDLICIFVKQTTPSENQQGQGNL